MRLKILPILIIVVLTSTMLGCQRQDNNGPLVKNEFLMDTIVTLKIYDKKDKKAMDEAIKRLKEIEDRMSVAKESSDLSLVNKNSGITPVRVHDDVYFVLERAKHFAMLTDGAYEPTIGALVKLWNITGKDGSERDSIPSEDEINKNMALVDYRDLELMDENYVYLKRKGMLLDLGGIVKGYAADEVKRIFKEHGIKSAIIDLGGNLYVLGAKTNGEPWRIGIQNPFKVTGNYFGTIDVQNKSIVTSGDYERFFIYKDKRYHHIIDPKTGYPSENEVSGISIVSDLSIDGDALSTALFVLGVEQGSQLVNGLEGIQEIFITKNEQIFINTDIYEQFSLKDNNFKLEKIAR